MKSIKFVLASVVFATASLAVGSVQAMPYKVCRATSRHIDAMHHKFTTGTASAAKEIADTKADSELYPDTKKLLVFMYNFADQRKGQDRFDFSQDAFAACLEFDPQWYVER